MEVSRGKVSLIREERERKGVVGFGRGCQRCKNRKKMVPLFALLQFCPVSPKFTRTKLFIVRKKKFHTVQLDTTVKEQGAWNRENKECNRIVTSLSHSVSFFFCSRQLCKQEFERRETEKEIEHTTVQQGLVYPERYSINYQAQDRNKLIK